jgi:hypothetical protein
MRAREFSFGTNLYLSGPELSSDRCLGHQLFFYLIASPHHHCSPGIYLDCFERLVYFASSFFYLVAVQSPLRGDTPAPWPP